MHYYLHKIKTCFLCFKTNELIVLMIGLITYCNDRSLVLNSTDIFIATFWFVIIDHLLSASCYMIITLFKLKMSRSGIIAMWIIEY